MTRVIALIDGEHYPPVVRFALEALSSDREVAAAVFIGGTEKVDAAATRELYGVPVVTGADRASALAEAIATYAPDAVIDLSDEPVVSSAQRFALASVALAAGVEYQGADFHFTPPRWLAETATPTIAVIGTGKRVGKTALSAYLARRVKGSGRSVAVLAMGRGGPEAPELIRGDRVELRTSDLVALAQRGIHAASDNYEDAVMSRVATVGCRRCGGGMAGETYFSNVLEGAALVDSLGCEIVVLEGSGAAIPPVRADATLLVIGAAQGATYARDFFGPYRLRMADAVVIAGDEPTIAGADGAGEVAAAVREIAPGTPVSRVTFRPQPLADVRGARVFFATTAQPAIVPALAGHLEDTYGCTVVGTSSRLSDRPALRADMAAARGRYDLLLTELKAAAIDVVAAAGEEAGVPTVLCDNVPVATGGEDVDALIDEAVDRALERGKGRAAR